MKVLSVFLFPNVKNVRRNIATLRFLSSLTDTGRSYPVKILLLLKYQERLKCTENLEPK